MNIMCIEENLTEICNIFLICYLKNWETFKKNHILSNILQKLNSVKISYKNRKISKNRK